MNQKKYWTPDQARTEMKRYCAAQERSHEEVKTKLIERGIYGQELENIMAELISDNFLNELRYAKAYVSGKFRINAWGKNKIKAGLKLHKISDYNLTKALATIDQEIYLQVLKDLLVKKKNTLTDNGHDLRKKLFAYALQKGYESSFIFECIDDICSEE